MARVKDVDTVAPDDLITPSISTPVIVSSKKLSPPPRTKSASGRPKIPPNSNQNIPLKSALPTQSALPTEPKITPIRQEIYNILGHTATPFSSFLVRPKVFKFAELDNLEVIILVLRRHWFTNLKWQLITLAMLFFPTLTTYVPIFDFFTPPARFIAVLFWYLLVFAYAFEQFLSWWFNVCVITDERVIDIDFNNLLVKKFTDAQIDQIQDVTSRVIGLAPTLFNYGTVLIQTASEIPEIEFGSIPNPEKVVKILQQLRLEEQQEVLEGRVR